MVTRRTRKPTTNKKPSGAEQLPLENMVAADEVVAKPETPAPARKRRAPARKAKPAAAPAVAVGKTGLESLVADVAPLVADEVLPVVESVVDREVSLRPVAPVAQAPAQASVAEAVPQESVVAPVLPEPTSLPTVLPASVAVPDAAPVAALASATAVDEPAPDLSTQSQLSACAYLLVKLLQRVDRTQFGAIDALRREAESDFSAVPMDAPDYALAEQTRKEALRILKLASVTRR